MKLLIMIAAALALSIGQLFSGTLRFPAGHDARFSFEIPAGWTLETDKDGTAEAFPANEELYLAAWEVEDMNDARFPAKMLQHLLGDCVKQIKLSAVPERLKVGAFPGVLFSGTGLDADDGSAVRFFAVILYTSREDASVVYLQADGEASKEEIGVLKAILASLKPL